MAERKLMCGDCCYLDKTKKIQTGVMYKYGCRCYHATDNKHIKGWLSSDNGLKQMGCSCCNRLFMVQCSVQEKQNIYHLIDTFIWVKKTMRGCYTI